MSYCTNRTYINSKLTIPDIDECDNNPCQNGGRCTNVDGSFSCSCTDGWKGSVCDQGNLKEINKKLAFLWFTGDLLIYS